MVLRLYLLFGAMAACVGVLAGCGSVSSPVPAPTQPPATWTERASVEIIQVPETGPYRDALAKGLGDVAWTAITDTTGISQETEARAVVLEGIKAHGGELAAVDYAALSLDAFKDVTRQLHLTVDSFVGGDARLEYTGEHDGRLRWLLYDYKGEMIPQLPERPQVFRWVQVYALYSIADARVIRLVATVRGEAQE